MAVEGKAVRSRCWRRHAGRWSIGPVLVLLCLVGRSRPKSAYSSGNGNERGWWVSGDRQDGNDGLRRAHRSHK
jgi:hypothetical protein